MPRSPDRSFSLSSPAVLAAVAALLSGCATAPGGGAPATAAGTPTAAAAAAPAASGAAPTARAGTPPAAGAAARPPAPGTPAPFADVTKDAQRADGYLPVWTKDEKTWIEIPAERLDQPFFFSISQASGLGERFFFPGLMGGDQVVVLRRVGNSVQLVARNLLVRAPAGTPLARALAESYSDSLLAAAPLAAAPHPERKALLVDASALLGGDLAGTQTRLEAAYRMPYALDRANSSITGTRSTADGTALTLRSHFAVPKLPAPPVLAPGAPPPNPAALPSPPAVVPDARSLFLSFTVTMAPLPAQPMQPRSADQRVGFFTDSYLDFGNDINSDRRTHIISRWRLEKQDPSAAVSPPKQPIRVVMDRNIPEKWRAPVRAGILEWNKAFERAGFQDAIRVEQQADDADWSTLEGTRLLAVRWFAIEGPGATAVGPSQSDPRTGEILRGAAIVPENWVRFFRSYAADAEPRLNGADTAAGTAPLPGEFARRWATCSYATDALEQAQFAHELLSARGDFDPRGPESERFITQSLVDVTMHEVGHALGLRHNFRASTGITRAQLRDPAFTKERGVSNSVMDYNALNIPLPGEPLADYHMGTLGAYDYWAIEYGYREFPAGTEAQELKKLAARSEREPALAYATDEDVQGIDPLVNQRDLGDDPLAFAQRQVQLTRELWTRTQQRTLAADDDMSVLRRNLQRGLTSMGAAIGMVGKYIGGTYTSRSLAGAQQPLLTPVDAAQQRAALDLILTEAFSSQSFRFDPAFMRRLGVDQLDRASRTRFLTNTDFSLPNAVLGLQRGALDSLMSDGLAARLADAEAKVTDTKTLLSYADVQERLRAAVWSELKPAKSASSASGEIDSLRRNLQREHLRRLATGLLRPGSMAAADVRAVQRQQAQQLATELRTALARPGWNSISRAHLADAQATLDEALKAPLVKQGV